MDGENEPSRDLVRRAVSGDRPALDALFERHLPGLRAWVRLRAGPLVLDRESASDIVHSACREVLERLDRFQWGGEAGFRHWLYETALRKVRRRCEHWKAARRDVGRAVAGDGAEGAEVFRTLASPSAEAVARETLEVVERAFRELSEAQQEVVAMSRVGGFSHEEIAALTGRDAATVRSQLHRGLAAIAEALVRARGTST